MNKILYFRRFFAISTIIATSAIITACSTAPSAFIVTPQLLLPSNNHYSGQHASVKVEDMRTAHHVLEIVKEDSAAQIVTSRTPLQTDIATAFTAGLKKSGLDVSSASANQLRLVINQAKITVEQSLSKYASQSVIRLTVQFSGGDKTLTKTFNSRSTSNGVLKADMAVLERDFNQQLSDLLTQVVQDPELQQFVQRASVQ
ncbi:YajG family lipoprotein [Thalassotalea sp. 1_MG-2023]|uniref:YajG family lipoprotein n=1 Tax=Thalassotalea sp. 1_MG-2023 TaxID=3062680 RepID=UPI0026E1BDC6|nr:YajG family lipoprotein [Thalassotalea sp. 1_MG-2023]MDO6428636.1 YajG family lipoprotein [Thalassotalea sp. 1_MG-2023]